MEADAPICFRCGYNLTALTSPRCPECGWVIDWSLAWMDEERRRPGTPAYRARGWRRALAIFPTLGLLLFRPIRFARILRYDEPLWPALLVATLAYLVACYGFYFRWGDPHHILKGSISLLAALLVSLAVNTLAFALLFRDSKGTLPWKRRLPLFARFSLYAMSFVAAWPFFSPPLLERWNRAGFFWPLAGDLAQQCQQVMHSTEILGGTIIFYWSLAILVTFSVVRSRPRWVAFFFVVSIPASTRLTWEIGERCYRLLTL